MTQPILTIDLDAAVANWRALDVLSGVAETGAAVKANGYGCGAAEIASALARAGCATFFAATLEEGIALRAAVPDVEIHILNGVADRRDSAAAIASDLRPCLNHLGQVDAWQRSEGGACALQLDSGMSRLGLPPNELAGVPEGLDVRLIMSHLSCADEPDHHSNESQRTRFLESVDILRGRAPMPDSASARRGVRCLVLSIILTSCAAVSGFTADILLLRRNPLSGSTRRSCKFATFLKGSRSGTAGVGPQTGRREIATLPLGYADGLHRALSNGVTLYFDGQPVPLVGRVSMDLITVDLTEHPTAQAGDLVEVMGPNQSVDDLAQAAGTIGYEILTSLGHRAARRYTGAGH